MYNDELKIKYGSWERFKLLSTKDPYTLYFLDNSEIYKGDLLLDVIHMVFPSEELLEDIDENGFPIIPTEEMRENYYISAKNGEIRFVDSDLSYIKITELMLENLLINPEFLEKLMKALADTKDIEMPTLTVEKNSLVWTASNVDSLTVYVPKQK